VALHARPARSGVGVPANLADLGLFSDDGHGYLADKTSCRRQVDRIHRLNGMHVWRVAPPGGQYLLLRFG
jgi:hypothetical protein